MKPHNDAGLYYAQMIKERREEQGEEKVKMKITFRYGSKRRKHLIIPYVAKKRLN